MKLDEVYPQVLADTKLWLAYCGKEKIREYLSELKETGEYKNFEVRAANDIVKYGALYHIRGTEWVCELYNKYKCTDAHITTLCKKVVKELNLIEQ